MQKTLIFLMAIFCLTAGESYAEIKRFMPSPPPTANVRSQQIIASPPAKFFPLSQARYPMPIRRDTNHNTSNVITEKEEITPPTPTKTSPQNNINISQEQAQQILSIFAGNK